MAVTEYNIEFGRRAKIVRRTESGGCMSVTAVSFERHRRGSRILEYVEITYCVSYQHMSDRLRSSIDDELAGCITRNVGVEWRISSERGWTVRQQWLDWLGRKD